MKEPAVETTAVLRELAADLSEPVGAGYTVSPDGRRVAVRQWPAYPSRLRTPVLLLHYGALGYDVARRAVVRRAPRIAGLAVYDTSTRERLVEGPGVVAGPPVWSRDGRLLAGLTPMTDGEGYGVWVLNVDNGTWRELESLRVGCSLLGLPAGARGPVPVSGVPLWWTRNAELVVARDAIDRDVIDPRDDIVAEPEFDDPRGEQMYHHDLLAIAAAARVELVVVDTETSRPASVLLAGCVLADAQLSPAGDRLLAGVAGDPREVAALVAGGVARYEVRRIERAGRGRSLGDWSVGAVRWRDGEVVAARPAGDRVVVRTLTADAAAGGGSVEFAAPVAAWLAPGIGGVLAITEAPGEGNATGARRLVAAGVGGAGVITVDGGMGSGPVWLRAVPARGRSNREAVVGLGGLGSRGERLLVLTPDDRRGLVRELLGPAELTERVIFVEERAALVERHDATGSALVRRQLGGTRDDEQVLHRVRPPVPSFPRAGREADGRLDTWAGYRLYVPPDGCGATLVELRVLPVDARLPEIAPGRLPPLSRAHLAAGTAVAILFLRWPAGEAVVFADIRRRLTGAVTELCSRLAAEEQVDPGRLVLAGHSFGAACAGVVLAHTPRVFRCAILRAGAYNRTLTPRGFQDERRDLWQARDIYDGFTLAYHAREIDCPVLILQGGADTNGVTDALQAWAFYDTLLAAGGHARLVLLYNEDHAFATREGLLTAAREELAWVHRWTAPAG